MFTMAYVHTAIEINHVYKHFDALDHTVGCVYWQKHAFVNMTDCVVSSTKMAIHTAGHINYSFI